ncbi:arrestin domain-containing protein 17 [Agrilus planipennis]|uniref:Arrestin domain-containing protein 17 n=1 Tax=Agrilus planipennis TaxID=224129 RepID=A0A1W4XL41_AGRPL|nr:arrestin domain-containing protein 17 [Agrilus planipennis]
MGLRLFEIFFDKPQKVFSPGETISGRVKVILDSPKKIRGLEFCCKGLAHTSWSESETVTGVDGKREQRNVEYRGDEEYFKIKYYLVGGKDQEMELPPGEHIYPFVCVLPPVLPSSFEGSKGYIRYTVKATLDRPWKFDHTTEVAITVISELDLNATPHLKETVTMTLEKYFCCLWCKSGPLLVEVFLPCSGYVPGQTITMNCNVDNASNVDINKITFTLKQKITFRSVFPSRHTHVNQTDIAFKSYSTPIPAKENRNFVEEIIVPSIPPSNLTNCSLIDLDYELKVEANVTGLHSNLTSKIPITIGTIPLQQGSNYVASAPSGHVAVDINNLPKNLQNPTIGWVAPTVGDAPVYPPPYPTAPNDLPPPYPADNSGNQSNNFSTDPGFKPLYPVYTFPNAPNS